MIEGDSTVTVPQFAKENPGTTFDLIHVDGAHDPKIADQDFNNIYPLASNTIIWDDTQDPDLRALLDG